MATTAKRILPDGSASDHPPVGQRQRKPMSKAHKAKLVAALNSWRASLTDEERIALAERNRQTHQQRWANMTERERKERLAGVKAWQADQRAAKRAAKAKAAPKPDPKAKGRRASRAASVGRGTVEIAVVGPNGTSKPSADNNVLANRRTRKAVAK